MGRDQKKHDENGLTEENRGGKICSWVKEYHCVVEDFLIMRYKLYYGVNNMHILIFKWSSSFFFSPKQ